jgi:hypothetical protein
MTPTADISRAMKALVETHGKNAMRIAEQRAEAADLGGSGAAAHIWREIAAALRQALRGR